MGIFKKENLPREEPDAVIAGRPTVLLVDDEEGNLAVMATILRPYYNLLQARDGEEALAIVRSLPRPLSLDCIVSDQRMPRLTGVELFEQLLPITPATTRIIVTGFVDVNVIVDAINKAQIYRFIVKPFDANDFLLTVQRAVESVMLQKELAAYHADLENKVRERTHELSRERDFSLGLVKAIPEVFFLVSEQGEVAMTNPNAVRSIGRSEEQLIGLGLPSLMAQRDQEAVTEFLAKVFAEGDATCEADLLFNTTDAVAHYLIGHRVKVDEGERAIVVAVNIATRRQVEEQMRFLALYDSLTELPNRTMLHDRLEHALAQGRRNGDRTAVLFLDLDGFKAVNDGAGHEAGDAVLRVVARRLRQTLRASDTVARYGGDEFVVLLSGVSGRSAAEQIACNLIAAVSEPITHAGVEHRVGASVGISFAPDDSNGGAALLELADAAMYAAKRRGKGCVEATPPGGSALAA